MKRIVTIMLAIAMVLSMAVIGVSADDTAFTDDGLIPGTYIGTAGWDGTEDAYLNAFDGDPDTFFDPANSADPTCYAGIACDGMYVLTGVKVLSRTDWASRYEGAEIMGSMDGEGWTVLFKSDAAATEGEWNIITEFTNYDCYKYFKYVNETNHGDVAEVEFYGYRYDAQIEGTVIGNATGWGDNAAAGAAAAFDGNAATFFDPLGVGDGFCGIDCGTTYALTEVKVLSRTDNAARYEGAMIQASNDGENWTTLYTAEAAAEEGVWNDITGFNGVGYQYYRYFNETNHGDVAEVEFYGYVVANAETIMPAFVDITANTVALVSNVNGFGGEGVENLIDDDVTTKYCCGFPTEEVETMTIKYTMDAAYVLQGISIATANDNAGNPGRIPNVVTVYGSANGKDWVELTVITNGLEDTNYTYYGFDVENTTAYRFYKFDITGCDAGCLQMSELHLYAGEIGLNPMNYLWHVSLRKQVPHYQGGMNNGELIVVPGNEMQ